MIKQLKGCHTPKYNCPVPMPVCASPKQENICAEVHNYKKLICSDCGFHYDITKHEHMIFNFCPNCGKKQPWNEYKDEVDT